jgi:SNF2 family DNA or RNA helicase
MEIELLHVGSTPVFRVIDMDPNNARVYGAVQDKDNGLFLFPAFPPFMNNTIHDLKAIRKDLDFSEEAQKYIDGLKTPEQLREEAGNLSLPVSSYEHQLDGLAEVLYNYRWILQWQMGTGKTKVMVDAIRLQGKTALILCPRVAINTWVKEVKKHSGETVVPFVIHGNNKLAQLQGAKTHQVIVTNYDTARNFGLPHLSPDVVQFFKDRGIPPTARCRKELLSINDPKTQYRFATEWSAGRKIAEIREERLAITAGNLQWLSDLPYETVIADESHRIKHIQSQQTKVALGLSRRASRRYLLTGTMSFGDPRDLYPQLKFLAPYLIPEDWRKFTERFLTFSPYNKKIVTGAQNLDILNRRVSRVSSVRKLDDCVALPTRRFELVDFNLTAAQRQMYNYAVKNWEIELPNAEPLELEHGAIRVNKLLQLCSGFLYLPADTKICDTCENAELCVSHKVLPGMPRCKHFGTLPETKRQTYQFPDNPKLDMLNDLLTDCLVLTGTKVIVWATYVEGELDIIESALKTRGVGYVRVDGSNSHRMQEHEEKFQKDPSCRVWLAQVHTGISVTLTAAQYMIYYSRSWLPDDREQSLFRNYRIGQTKKTVVYDLVARFSLEEQQLHALKTRKESGELMTHRQQTNCVFCAKFAECRERKIAPWEEGCVLPTKATRDVARARTIP